MNYSFYEVFGAILQLVFVFMVLPVVLGLFITRTVIKKQQLEEQKKARIIARRRELKTELIKEKGYF